MHHRLRAFALVVLLAGGLTIAAAGTHDLGGGHGHGHGAVMATATRSVPVVSTVGARHARDRLPSLVAALAALVLAATVVRRAVRPLWAPNPATASSTRAPSRAPPSLQNFAF